MAAEPVVKGRQVEEGARKDRIRTGIFIGFLVFQTYGGFSPERDLDMPFVDHKQEDPCRCAQKKDDQQEDPKDPEKYIRFSG